jgi:hypothetical protein
VHPPILPLHNLPGSGYGCCAGGGPQGDGYGGS